MGRGRYVRAGLLVAGLVALAAAPASASGRKMIEPLNQYVVTGKVDPEDLARRGFDLTEAQVKGKRGFAIVATPSQAAELAGKDVTVRPLARGARTAAVPAPSPLTDPTHGYDVFRPWSLKPAACPTTCATPRVPLKDFYDDLARRNSDVVQKYVYGKSLLGQDLVAYKVTRNAQSERTGSRPAVLYESTQHAREWIAAETERRLFEYVLHNKNQTGGFGVRQLLGQKELWFVPIVNPDGYDYTFTAAATRLWRKNLRDNNADGAITNGDGVDTNRNWSTKFNYDLEGASNEPASETFHGSGPASEPEVRALRDFVRNTIRPVFMIDYHSFAQLILYPEGWQVETPATDAPLMASLAGDNDTPAVAGFDPDVSAELYTTNGDVTDDLYTAFGTLAYTVELDGGSGGAVGGTDASDPNAYTPGGFVFQDRESDVAVEARKNFAFAVDLAKSADDPTNFSSHLGNTAPDLVPTTFPISYGDPQTVEVNAKRQLGRVTLHWRVNGGREHRAPTTEFRGGSRYGEPGVYYHVMRGDVTGTFPGDKVEVWFTARGASSAPLSYEVKNDTDHKVLILGAEDYSGLSPNTGANPGPKYLDYYETALADAGIGYDVYDVDARGRTAPTNLGVLSHYTAVVWYTGDDLYVRGPEQRRPGGSAAGGTTGTEKLFDEEILASRDFMNEGGKLLVTGKTALQGAWDQFLYNPLGPTPPRPLCPQNQSAANDDPPGQSFNCVAVSNDFQQYWLGAWLPISYNPASPLVETPLLGSTEFGLNGTDSAGNQDSLYSLLTTSSILPADAYPQFKSEPAIKVNAPAAFDPPTGSQYVYSQQADSAYKRLTRTIDLTGHTAGDLKFKLSYDTEAGYDYVFVEAHTVGQADWTTLPDRNGNTSQDTSLGCPDDNPFWLQENPFLTHYITRSGTTGAFACAPTGTSGSWNAATRNSAGFHDWDVDLTPFAGKQVEVSITYATDPANQGLGVFVDDTAVVVDGKTVSQTSFEDDLGGWSVPGAPADSGSNSNDWQRTGSVGFVEGPGIATDHSLYWGFGLEGVTDRATRATLMGDAMRHFGLR